MLNEYESLIAPEYMEQYEQYKGLPDEKKKEIISILSKPSTSQSEEENIQQLFMVAALKKTLKF